MMDDLLHQDLEGLEPPKVSKKAIDNDKISEKKETAVDEPKEVTASTEVKDEPKEVTRGREEQDRWQ